MRTLSLPLIFVLASSCAGDRGARVTDTSRADSPAVPATEPPRAEVPEAARRLVAAHNDLVAEGPTLEHRYVVLALRSLADALDVVVPERRTEISRVRESARLLARSDVSAHNHAELVRDALAAAGRALGSVKHDEPTSLFALRLEEAARSVVNASRAIDADAGLLPQYGHVRVGMRQATRAVFAALGADEPRLDVHTARAD